MKSQTEPQEPVLTERQEATKRQTAILAALATDPGASFTPVQVQKLFFLLNERVTDKGWKKRFKFKPHLFGPFDPEVYSELEVLKQEGLVDIWGGRMRKYSLTADGYRRGQSELEKLPSEAKNAIRILSEWVRTQNLAGLVSAVYKEFPKMKANSLFQETTLK